MDVLKHDQKDAEHVFRTEIQRVLGPYVRRLTDEGIQEVREAVNEAYQEGRFSDAKYIGETAARRVAAKYLGVAGGVPREIEVEAKPARKLRS